MPPLVPELRRDLERAVVAARDTAEAGARNALAVLGTEADRAPDGLSAEQRRLRTALRAQARSLGGGVATLGWDELREEIAYAVWHRMLFARFLAENGLLIEPASKAPVSLGDVAELAQRAGERDPWVLAARYAAEMLPGIFGTADPTTQVAFAPDDRLRLEAILTSLPAELFTADDALGWVYQFWQSKRKAEVNKKGDKIGGADLAPVTQLFTEHYMVRFLLENSLGAWWAGRHPDSPLLRRWEYLRYRDDGTPAAGTFEGWPDRAAEITVMDPCLGSGHFLVAAADMLRAMRMEEENLSEEDAAAAVLTDNLYGLELDPRCTQLAAFALAFDAWKAAARYLTLPVPNVACSGIAIKGQLDDWRRLAGNDTNMADALERLYELFQDAPELGSLIDPRSAAGEGLWAVDPDALLAKLDRALVNETEDPAAAVFGAAAQGTAKAARLLARRYWLVATNPPFLGSGGSPSLDAFGKSRFPDSRFDTAAMFLEAALMRWSHSGACAAYVQPTAVLLLGSFSRLRQRLLRDVSWPLVATLGAQAFSAISGEVVRVALVVLIRRIPTLDEPIHLLDVTDTRELQAKIALLAKALLSHSSQGEQLANDDARVLMSEAGGSPLYAFADVYEGTSRGDTERFDRKFWELATLLPDWTPFLNASTSDGLYVGREHVMWWEDGRGALAAHPSARIQGLPAWGRPGVFVGRTGSLHATPTLGSIHAQNGVALVPRTAEYLLPVLLFARSSAYRKAVRRLSEKLVLPTSTMNAVPFDLEYWTKVAAEQYPNGLPEPHSDDPTQWLFKGGVVGSEAPLQVAMGRFLGYRWPDQEPDELDRFVDPDGIVCLPAVAGDLPAAELLEKLLAAAYRDAWTPGLRQELLAGAGGSATSLDAWLRDEFFAQHARLFHNRPFMWQVWDGRRDGFSALLHYHRLDRATLEKLTFHHLGEWLDRQRAETRAGELGADLRLAAATELQTRLRAILEGEPPFDIYVRWKSLAEQALGWEPDLDDGVRLNIRPFVTAGVLRAKFTINWNTDRGKNPDGSERVNDHHFTLAEKRAAREAKR